MKKTYFASLIIFITIACSSTQQITNSNILISKDNNYYHKEEAQKYFSVDGISMKFFDNKKFLDIIVETNKISTLEKIFTLGLGISIKLNNHSSEMFNINFPLATENIIQEEYISKQISKTQNFYDTKFNKIELITQSEKCLINISRYDTSKGISIYLKRNKDILFSYLLRIDKDMFFASYTNTYVDIGIASVYEYEERQLSSMTSKEVIKQRLDEYKVGNLEKSNKEINEKWVRIKLSTATKNKQ